MRVSLGRRQRGRRGGLADFPDNTDQKPPSALVRVATLGALTVSTRSQSTTKAALPALNNLTQAAHLRGMPQRVAQLTVVVQR